MTRPPPRRLSFALLGLLLACANACAPDAAPPPATPVAPTPTAPVPRRPPSAGQIAPFALKLFATDANGVARAAELDLDGTLMLDGMKLAEIQDNRIVAKDGELVATDDGKVTVSRLTEVGTFAPNGDLVDGHGRGLRIDDTGAIFHLTSEGGADPFPGRLEGFAPPARRTALLFIVAVMAFGPTATAAR